MKISVVVFDLDGTLLNTLEHVVQAFERVMEEHGEVADRKQIIAAIGPPLIDCYKTLLPAHDALKAADRHHELQQTDDFLELIEEYTGLRETLAALRASGYKVAIFTNRWKRGVDMIFDRLDLHKAFDMIVTPEAVAHGKPDPEGLQLIAKQFDVPTSELAMVGDLLVDIETGIRAEAGLTIGVTHGFGTREELDAAGASQVVDSLAEIRQVLQKQS